MQSKVAVHLVRPKTRSSVRSMSVMHPNLKWDRTFALMKKGEPMFVHGYVRDIHGNPLAGAKIDVWQANDEGFYDVQQRGVQPGFNLRGVFRTGADGRYWFKAIKPKFYPIP